MDNEPRSRGHRVERHEPDGGIADIGGGETAELLRRAAVGDRAALDGLVEQLTSLVWNVARAQGLDAESAADAVAATWVQFVRNLHLIEVDTVIGWLVKATRRNARGLRPEGGRAWPASPSDRPDPGAGAAADEQYRCLWDNLRKLPPTCRESLRILAFARPDPSDPAVLDVPDPPSQGVEPTGGTCLEKLRALLRADPRWAGAGRSSDGDVQ